MKIFVKLLLLILFVFAILFCFIYFNKGSKINELDMTENINTYVDTIMKTDNINEFKDNVDEKILGDNVKDYLEIIEGKDIEANIIIYDNKAIRIEPYPDPLETQIFYYEDNKLVLYISESNSIGGIIKYYFKNDKLIKTVNDSERTVYEQDNEILIKSKNIYNKYIKR